MNAKVAVLTLGLLLVSSPYLMAGEMKGTVSGTVAEVDAAAPVAVNNKICPVSGGSVTAMGEPYQIEHNGKLYNLCCEGCVKDFQADPEKYSKIAEEEVAAGEAEAATGAEAAVEDHSGHDHHHE